MFDAINKLFDLAMRPMENWPPEASCALFSVLIGVALLFLFKYISMQSHIERVKDRMTACILGVWLYRDRPGMIARSQLAAVGHGLHYLGLNFIPLLIMALPMMLVLAQMNAYLAHRPLKPGDETIVTATLSSADTAGLKSDVTLTTPPGTKITAANRDPAANQIAWRIACGPTSGPLEVHAGNDSASKSLVIGPGVQRVEPLRTVAGFWHMLLYPSEPSLPENGAIQSIHVAYPERDVNVFIWGLPTHWLWSCFLIMLVAVFMLRKPMGVSI